MLRRQCHVNNVVVCRVLTLILIIMVNNSNNNDNGVRVEAFHEENKGLNSIAAVQPISSLHRTAYHFQPSKHWINDPNAPMYYNGIYHLFYQYNPKGALWGNIVWAHSISTDLISWQSVSTALIPSKPFDINGCWSGSATILPNNKPVILYTGLDVQSQQVQNIAIPSNLSDPYLRDWVKPDYNPISVPGPDINSTFFRDPTTAWRRGNHWEIVVGSERKKRGIAFLYRSKDFRKWIRGKHPLHSKRNTGMWECVDFYPVKFQYNSQQEMGMSLNNKNKKNNKYVFKVSLDETRYDYYTIGRYDEVKDVYLPDKDMIDGWDGLRYDYGNFYASKSFYDPKKNRRIVWAWANESDSMLDDVTKGWAGIQLIPRAVWLDPSGKQLLQWPVEELNTLRVGDGVQIKHKKLKKGEMVEIKGDGLTPPQADVEVVFKLPKSLDKADTFDPSWVNAMDLCGQKGSTVQSGIGPFGLLTLASKRLEEYTPVFFRVFKAPNKHVVLMCSDATRSTLTEDPCQKHYDKKNCMYKPSFGGFVDVDLKDRKLPLRTLIDHSVIESFAARGKTCISSRVYPKIAIFDKAHLYAFNNGTEPITIESLHAWGMRKPQHMNDPLPSAH